MSGRGTVDRFSVQLLGRPVVKNGQTSLFCLDQAKSNELLCFLLLNRSRAFHRDSLATILWPEASSQKARRYLSKSLWKVQRMLTTMTSVDPCCLFAIESDWIMFVPNDHLWLDVADFEGKYEKYRNLQGTSLASTTTNELETAVELYRGDLLEGWYQDWCLRERERLLLSYIELLDKLVDYALANELLEKGVTYATRLLQADEARERTYRSLMILDYKLGERGLALRQYQRCCEVMQREFSMDPEPATTRLYDEIRSGNPAESVESAFWGLDRTRSCRATSDDELHQIRKGLVECHKSLLRELQALEEYLRH